MFNKHNIYIYIYIYVLDPKTTVPVLLPSGAVYVYGAYETGIPTSSHLLHTCHILPPSEMLRGLFWAVLKGSKVKIYFVEMAERVEYGNYVRASN